jgi:TetR/AcrR family transcriptional regulator, cholesterol catabolism regulator
MGVQEAGSRRNRSRDLIEAAIVVFHRKGYASASIEEIAATVGVRKGSVYHYIDSKEELLALIFEQSDGEASKLLEGVAALDLPAVDRLYALARNWTLWYMANIERITVYLADWTQLTGARRDQARAIRRDQVDRLISIIDEVKSEGGADPELDSAYAAYFLFSAVNGLVTWYRREGPDPAERIAEAYAQMIVRTVVGSSEVTPPVGHVAH